MNHRFKELFPGFLLLAIVAVTAQFFGTVIPFLSPLILAILIGAIVSNTCQLPKEVEKGVSKHSLLLETAIVLLGASLSLKALIKAGPLLIVLVLAVVMFGLLLVTALSRAANLNDRMGSLLAVGSSICGVSAIAAVAPVCDAEETQIAHAAATILVFDAITLIVFPAIEQIFHFDPQFYGIWIGLSMFSTGPVVAAGFQHSAVAGKWATMTKLARNAMIGAVAVGYSLRYTRMGIGETRSSMRKMWTEFPKFLVGFILVAILTNTNMIPNEVVGMIKKTSEVLFLFAFAGLGLKIRFDNIQNTGIVPLSVVGTYLLIVSLMVYLFVSLLF